MPIFSKSWWLDSVCGSNNWDVALVEQDDKIIASLPYFVVTKAMIKMIVMPQFTQTMGPYIIYPADQKYDKKLSYEKTIMSELIKSLPKVHKFSQNFHPSIENWLPFYWHDYEQTTRYSYVIEDLSNLEKVSSGFSRAKRRNIKRAEKIVEVKYDLPVDEFYKNHSLTLKKQNKKIDYEFDLLEQMYTAAYLNQSGATIYAIDEANNIHAALFIIWDQNSAYDLISTIDPDFRDSGAATLLVREAIRHVAGRTTKFDFEGSMVENVEASFRQFGAIQKQYFRISKINSQLLQMKKIMSLILR